MNEYLDDALTAFRSVPEDYFNTTVLHTSDPNDQEEIEQSIERVFTSEFYHHWRVIMDDNSNRYENLILHTEIGKRLGDGARSSFPDLALHGGQVGRNRNDNKVLVEIKMDHFDNSDLHKLIGGIEYLNYERSLYIITNASRNQIIVGLRNFDRPEFLTSKVVERLYFLTRNNDSLIAASELITPYTP